MMIEGRGSAGRIAWSLDTLNNAFRHSANDAGTVSMTPAHIKGASVRNGCPLCHQAKEAVRGNNET
jgi:hypothetical protein